MANGARIRLSPTEFVLDTGATAHLCDDSQRDQAREVHEIPCKPFQGVGGTIYARHSGILHGFDTYFVPDLGYNLISWRKLAQLGYELKSQGPHVLICYCPTSSDLPEYRFERSRNLYALVDKENTLGTRDDVYNTALAASARATCTKSDMKRAQRARNYHSATGHRGRNLEAESIRSNAIDNVKVTLADLLLSDQLLGTCPVCATSKATRTKKISIPPRIHTSVIGHTQHCDVFFAKVPYTGAYNKPRLRPFFIFVDEATHQIVIYHSNSRSLVSFAQAIRCVNAFYSCNGHTQLQALYCDNEAAVRAYEEEFNLSTLLSGVHTPHRYSNQLALT